MTKEPKIGLVLSGGGARGAYQVGVLRGILDITRTLGIKNPFQILTGVSAGAVNAAYLAAHADDIYDATKRLENFWFQLHCEHIYRTDPCSIGQIGLRWALDIISGATHLGHRAHALLDTAPLSKLLEEHIPFEAIRTNLENKTIDAACISATDYATTECISFYMLSHRNNTVVPWQRSRRIGIKKNITKDEVMASSAIPLLFPPVQVGQSYFGDGCLRNMAPLSPAIHLGADRLIIIGVRKAIGINPSVESLPPIIDPSENFQDMPSMDPSLARILSVIINAVLLDAVDADIERLARINHTVSLLDDDARPSNLLRPIDWLYFHPSVDIAQIAIEEVRSMPRLIRYLFAGLGSLSEASDMISYLLFEPPFCKRLLKLGYADALAKKQDILDLFKVPAKKSKMRSRSQKLEGNHEARGL